MSVCIGKKFTKQLNERVKSVKVSFRIERFQFGSWTIVRLNIATKETAEAEAAAMKSESTLPLQIVKVTEEVIG